MKSKTVLLLIALVIIGSLIWYFESTKLPTVGDGQLAADDLKDGKYPRAPELEGIVGTINAKENLTIADLRGKVIIVDFWTYTCINCIRTLPYLVEWDRRYREKGLVIIGVHTPEFEFEKEYENVLAAVREHNISYPVVQDNDYATWRAYANRYWPHKYLIDSEGYIRYHHIGEGGYEETERMIQTLLSEIGSRVEEDPFDAGGKTGGVLTTPELYLGHSFALERGQNVGNEGGLRVDSDHLYILPEDIEYHQPYLSGKWYSAPEAVESEGAGSVVLGYSASSVNIVATVESTPVRVDVFLDGKSLAKTMAGSNVQFDSAGSYILVDSPKLYSVVKGESGKHVLALNVTRAGFALNTYTFG